MTIPDLFNKPLEGKPDSKLGRVLRATGRALVFAFLVLWGIGQLYPLGFLLMNSLKSNDEFLQAPWAIPTNLHFSNYLSAWQGGEVGIPLGRYFFNSVIITVGTGIVVALVAALAAYALARYKFPGANLAQFSLFWILAIPVHAVLIPVFHMMGNYGLRNTYYGIIGLYAAFWIPFTIVVLRAHFEHFPRELIEAGMIDGCTEIGSFFKIVLPVSRGALSSISIVNMIGIWSELLFAFVILNRSEMKTLTVGVLAFQGQYATDWANIFAGMSIATLPLIVVFFFFQSQITKGFSMGALR